MSVSLPTFKAITKNSSEIIDDAKRQIISYFLPSLIRMREWSLLFSISSDGVSMNTFYSKTHSRDNTVMLIKDDYDHIFGAFCCEQWKPKPGYYGRGENFVFTFETDDDIKYYSWAGGDVE